MCSFFAFTLELGWKRGFVGNADLRSLHKLTAANPKGQRATWVKQEKASMAPITIDRYVHLIPAVKHSPKQYLWSSYDAEADALYVNFKISKRKWGWHNPPVENISIASSV